jgi:hypothetical protein
MQLSTHSSEKYNQCRLKLQMKGNCISKVELESAPSKIYHSLDKIGEFGLIVKYSRRSTCVIHVICQVPNN